MRRRAPLHSHIRSAGAWAAINDAGEREALFEAALSGQAQATVAAYLGSLRRCSDWARQRHYARRLPFSSLQAARYLKHVADNARTPAPVEAAAAAISWAHRLADLADPLHSAVPRAIVSGARRGKPRNRNRKAPMSAEGVRRIVATHGSQTEADARCRALVLLLFTAMLRIGDLRGLRRRHICIEDGSMRILLEQAKNDQFRDGNERVVAAIPGSPVCPVAALRVYMAYDASSSEDAFVFHKVARDDQLSYSLARSVVKSACAKAGLDGQFGTHSFRSGAATAAANAGVPDRLIRRAGNWRSDSSKNRYISDSLASRLSVSQNLGL